MGEKGLLATILICALMFIGSTAFLSIFGIMEKYSDAKWLRQSKRGDIE